MMSGIVLAAVLVACGSNGAPGKPAATGAAKATIVSFKYAPNPVTVSKGTAVSFDNKDNASHTVTADNGSFDSGTILQGASKALTFSKAGTFTYHCAFHPFMHGTIVVR